MQEACLGKGNIRLEGATCLCSRIVTTVTKGFEEVAEREIYGPPTPSVLTQKQVYSDRDTKSHRQGQTGGRASW